MLYIKFPDKESYFAEEAALLNELAGFDGNDSIVIYCEKEKARKELPKSRNISVNANLPSKLYERYGQENVKVADKPLVRKGR